MDIAVDTCVLEQGSELADRFTRASTWERADAQWPSHEQRTLVCCRVLAETHDVRTFVFAAEQGKPFTFEPGQFVTVTAEIEGKPVSRCYTISSPPTRPYTLSITVKRAPGGVMSNWLHDNMTEGSTLSAYGPSGIFTPSAGPSEKALYLSAGSGVTPLMSMTRAAFDLGQDRDIVFVHSARTPEDIIFAKELAALEQVSRTLRVIHICEAQSEKGDWQGPLGRLSLDLLKECVPDYQEREVFTCGPAGYMEAVRKTLLDGNHNPSRYHQESFNFAETVEVVEAAPEETASAQPCFTVRLARSGKTFTVDASQTVLAAARKAGVPLPSSCSQGICGTCKTTLLEGTVEMKHNGGIRPREIDRGLRLMCCSKPTSDIVLDM
ncbi:hybrid-cluster NAD(P)-dependent oxidoreductase [Paraburkholderia rhynchosiae]|uniref:3-ketosteroid-9-alpha-monooxygenase, ferredoxin reductase component n=1 Tax=Paraburkholderia rhynchosiae TaxID=487049 RepID=A0A2N7WXP3_9BURK|nr:hybrid-cluster NAD(P)-dependent oxidoreductase [Paraburkholderia rhynchosiae]PMS34239.1 hybrid-cluster NAD(P)-dependent oxidoreductase [Paraburkholderia rhynchosiae]CAB3637954.1 3-ketosteroid-9-alpha-monooxygenase, ferredoxin reductase component [Paraburkholderia rhynchosiae]